MTMMQTGDAAGLREYQKIKVTSEVDGATPTSVDTTDDGARVGKDCGLPEIIWSRVT